METSGQRSSVIAMKQALEALEKVITAFGPGLTLQQKAATALRQALEEEREPLCWTVSTGWVYADYERGFVDGMQHQMQSSVDKAINKQREWVGLTDEEIFSILENLQTIYNRPPTEDSRIIFAQAIEAKLKERNHG